MRQRHSHPRWYVTAEAAKTAAAAAAPAAAPAAATNSSIMQYTTNARGHPGTAVGAGKHRGRGGNESHKLCTLFNCGRGGISP